MRQQIITKFTLPTESYEQKMLVDWWQWQYPQYSMLLFHIPNGGLRNKIVASKLKREGVIAGVADLFLCIPTKKSHGLFIEMKRIKGGKQSESQKNFETSVVSMGYAYKLCHGFMDAKENIVKYLGDFCYNGV